jgi:hypothetical protein
MVKKCLRRPGGLFSRKLPPWTPRKSFSYTVSHRAMLHKGISHWYHFFSSCLPTANRQLTSCPIMIVVTGYLLIFVILVIVIWNLFVICDLEFVIFIFSSPLRVPSCTFVAHPLYRPPAPRGFAFLAAKTGVLK